MLSFSKGFLPKLENTRLSYKREKAQILESTVVHWRFSSRELSDKTSLISLESWTLAVKRKSWGESQMINVSSNPEIYTNEILGLNATFDCLLKNFCKHITVGKLSNFWDIKKLLLMTFEPNCDKNVSLMGFEPTTFRFLPLLNGTIFIFWPLLIGTCLHLYPHFNRTFLYFYPS